MEEQGLTFLFAAYSAIWIILMAYAFFLWNKHAKLRKEVQALKRALKKKG